MEEKKNKRKLNQLDIVGEKMCATRILSMFDNGWGIFRMICCCDVVGRSSDTLDTELSCDISIDF